jgi:GTP cyclohydrolase IA
MIYYSPDDFKIDCESLAQKIKQARLACKVIYGIPQGGTALAMELSRLLGKRVIDTKELSGWNKECVLVVDDIVDSGATISRFEGYKTATLHVKPSTPVYFKDGVRIFPDFHCSMVDDWITYWWEATEQGSIENNITRILQYIGEDPTREGLVKTPYRVVKSWKELFGGYKQDPAEIFTSFDSDGYQQLVLLKDVEFYSTCEHHALSFGGRAHIGYIPDKRVVGISKLARVLDIYARRLQIQERIGEQVVDAIMEHMKPIGAACILEAKHLCMQCRGVEKQHSTMVTSSLRGVFMEKTIEGQAARAELMSLIK